jgi:hypothetical protein
VSRLQTLARDAVVNKEAAGFAWRALDAMVAHARYSFSVAIASNRWLIR